VQDAMAAATGVVGSATTQASDSNSADVMDLLFMDHQKAKTLISEIRDADNADQIKVLFGQLYKDLVVHAKAEDAVVYPAVEPFYGDDTQELYDETAEIETLLNELKAMPSTGDQFMAKLKQLKAMIGDHTGRKKAPCCSMRKNLSSDSASSWGDSLRRASRRSKAKCSLDQAAEISLG
jgi:hemerythrin superfamily protein